MSTLLLALALCTQAKVDPDQFPLALHRSMEIDDLDRELQRLHDTVLLRRGQLASTQRLAQRGLVSRSDLERDTAALRYEEAHEAETRAYRELKAYERDVMGRAIAADEVKAYSLLLDWLKKQESMSRVDLEYRDFNVRQTRSLFQRKAVSRQELEDAELNYNTAQASVALSRSRQAQVALELAARRGERPYEAAEYDRLKNEYLNARIQYYEIILAGARSRLSIAIERSRRGLIPPNELALFQKAADDAEATLAAERKKVEKPQNAAADAPATNG
jgi:multidrug resistance efflux pump